MNFTNIICAVMGLGIICCIGVITTLIKQIIAKLGTIGPIAAIIMALDAIADLALAICRLQGWGNPCALEQWMTYVSLIMLAVGLIYMIGMAISLIKIK